MRKTSAKKQGAAPTDETAAGSELSEGQNGDDTDPHSGDGLHAYRRKRDPSRSNEPFGAERKRRGQDTGSGRFVVHLHAATRTHYDLRLQVGSTLTSFAVPKGPTLAPNERRLAIQTEAHPIEYLDFEDVIPEGNYGAGPMIIWDTGRVSYAGDAERGLAAGKLDFDLFGFKLAGRFGLIRTRPRGAAAGPDDSPEWLLVKKDDVHTDRGRDVLDERPRSVLSGLTVDELPRRAQIAERLEQRAAELGAPERDLETRRLTPMLCAQSGAGLDDPQRVYEPKLDGVRIIADHHSTGGVLRYRGGRTATQSYPEIARAVSSLPPQRVVLDGEIVAFDDTGHPSFQRLAPRIHAFRPHDVQQAMARTPVVYVIFDILQLGSRHLVELPLRKRKQLLMNLVAGKGLLRALDHLEGDGRPLMQLCHREGLEGLVAKRADSPYRPGPRRSTAWVKIKSEREADFVVIGWTSGKGSRRALGSLCLATYVSGQLVYRGKVGSGLSQEIIQLLEQRLHDLQTEKCPLHHPPDPDVEHCGFVRPELVVSVRFSGWTDEGRLRAPVFRGVRADVPPGDCHAAPPPERLRAQLPERADAGAAVPIRHGPTATTSRVKLSNRDKVFWPDEGYTKGDLCNYYAAVSDGMLPFLKRRPLVLFRFPDGIEGKSFFQWNAPAETPDWVRTVTLPTGEEGHGGDTLFLVDDVDSLLHVANLGAIEIHVLARRAQHLRTCDFLTIDFDIGTQPFRQAVTLARTLRELLEHIGLHGFPKTSGKSGLHVLIPMGTGVAFDTAKLLVELLGRLLVAHHPDLATMERRVSRRGARVYVDTGQTGASRSIVAPYSLRARPGATVSTPLQWEELHGALDPARFTLLSVPDRVAELGDPMAGMFEVEVDVEQAIPRLEQWVRPGDSGNRLR